MSWINLAQDSDKGRELVNMVMKDWSEPAEQLSASPVPCSYSVNIEFNPYV